MRAFAARAFVLSLAAAAAGCGGSPRKHGLIVFRCGPGYANLCAVDADGENNRRLTHDGRPHGLHYETPSLSGDGRTLGFEYGDDLYVAAPDLTERRRLKPLGDILVVRLDRSGRRLAVAPVLHECLECRRRRPSFDVVALRSGRVERTPGKADSLSWAGDGLVMARSDLPTRLWFSSGRGFSHRRRVDLPPGLAVLDVAASPDGSLIAATVQRSNRPNGIVLLSASTGKLVRTLVSGRRLAEPAWSPDGNWIVFRTRGGLAVVPAAGGQARSLGLDGREPTSGGSS